MHGGKRNGAGRKASLETKTIENILRLSAYNIIRALRSSDEILSLKDKAELGKHFVLKKIPTTIESDGSFAPKMVMLLRNDRAVEEESKLIDDKSNR